VGCLAGNKTFDFGADLEHSPAFRNFCHNFYQSKIGAVVRILRARLHWRRFPVSSSFMFSANRIAQKSYGQISTKCFECIAVETTKSRVTFVSYPDNNNNNTIIYKAHIVLESGTAPILCLWIGRDFGGNGTVGWKWERNNKTRRAPVRAYLLVNSKATSNTVVLGGWGGRSKFSRPKDDELPCRDLTAARERT